MYLINVHLFALINVPVNVPINGVKNVHSLSNKMFTRNVAINVHFEAAF